MEVLVARKNVIGHVFGRLTIVAEDSPLYGMRRVVCECSCGGGKTAYLSNLKKGLTASCGCLQRERASQSASSRIKHGQYRTPEYRCWRGILQRCHNPRNKQFKDYGGRGIKMCYEWRNDFPSFLAHVGKRPSSSHSLDRRDNNLAYEPGNVRWATHIEQHNNTRQNRIVDVDGSPHTLAEAIRLKGQRSNVVRQRIAIGWSVERALNTPIVPSPRRGIKRRNEATNPGVDEAGRKAV
jgi:hypothetical protein